MNVVIEVTTEEDSENEMTHQCEWQHRCVFDWVDWDAMELAAEKLKKQDCDRWLRTTKMMNDLLHADVWSEQCAGAELKCFDCGLMEHQRHMLLCRHEGRQEHREDVGQMLQRMLHKQDTASELTNVMSVCLKRWEELPDDNVEQQDELVKVNGNLQLFRRNDEPSEQMFQSMQNQSDMGWDNFLKGRISNHWSQAQEVF